MKIGICDDDPDSLRRLAGTVRQSLLIRGWAGSVCCYDSADQLLAEARDPELRVCFLSLHLSGTSGEACARALNVLRPDCAIVLTASRPGPYSVGYELGAVHCLVRPEDENGVAAALGRCAPLLREPVCCAEFRFNRINFRLPLEEIRYVEVLHNICTLHAQYAVTTVASLKNVLNRLDDPRFFRCHRSYAVNFDYISCHSSRQIVLRDGHILPLSRTCLPDFDRRFSLFRKGTMGRTEPFRPPLKSHQIAAGEK